MEPPTVREVIKMLENEGFVFVNQAGSHRQYRKGNLKVTVAGKPSMHLSIGTWKRIKQQANW